MVPPVRSDLLAARHALRAAFATPAAPTPLPAAVGALFQSESPPPPNGDDAPAGDRPPGEAELELEPGAEPTGWFARRLVRGDDATLWAVRLGLCAVVVGWLAVIVSLFV